MDGAETMSILKISSKTTLQKLRDEGKIRFSQPQKKVILYDRNSINEYIATSGSSSFEDRNAKNAAT